MLDQETYPVEELVAAQLRQQIVVIEAAPDVREIGLLRNPWLE